MQDPRRTGSTPAVLRLDLGRDDLASLRKHFHHGLLVLLAIAPPVLAQTDAETLRQRRVTPIVEVVRKVGPAVVNIRTTGVVEVRDPFFRFFYGPNQQTQSLGSGVVIDPDGYVVTNAHVVLNANEQVQVTIGNGESTAAEVIWIDEGNDLALLRIREGAPLPAVRLGTAADVMIGETVVALGNPYGFDNTVSYGIVSATNRALTTPTGASFVDFIQTDAALHPGNSGGPLANINGEVIGINTMVQTGTEAIGFAIPADRVKKILVERLTNFSQINGVYLGARIRASEADEPLVRFVEANSPAAFVGLAAGDVVRAVGDRPTPSVFDFNKRMLDSRPGDEIALEIERQGERKRVQVRLGTYSQNPEEILWRRLGLRVADRDQYNRRFNAVAVVQVQAGGPANSIDLRRGDLIYKVNGAAVESFETFYFAVTEATEDLLRVDVHRRDPRSGRSQLYEGEISLRPLKSAY